jgi:hypothetical protein
MAYFAKVDENNIVTEVIIASQETIDSGIKGDASDWIETYSGDGTPIRYNAASKGYTYDKVNDAFIPPQMDTQSSWTLDANFIWQPPVPYPDDNESYGWDDDNQKWIQTTGPLEKIETYGIRLNTKSWSRAAGGTLSVTLMWNERVTVTGTPTLVLTNDSRTNHTLSYVIGSGTSNIAFTLTIAANNSAIQKGDVLSIAAQNIVLAGGSTIQFIDPRTGIPKDVELAITADDVAGVETITATA